MLTVKNDEFYRSKEHRLAPDTSARLTKFAITFLLSSCGIPLITQHFPSFNFFRCSQGYTSIATKQMN